jgi:hypothetical protein
VVFAENASHFEKIKDFPARTLYHQNSVLRQAAALFW